MIFDDRHEAGRRLASQLLSLVDARPVVVALPRGGVPVAAEVAAALHAPLEVLAVRKLGAPDRRELAVGALAEDGIAVVDREIVRHTGTGPDDLQDALDRESRELRRRVRAYRGGRPPQCLRDKTAIVVDDGLATGLTALAAVRAVRSRGARRVVLAVPVGSPDAVWRLRDEVDEVVCLSMPRDFRSVGQWYADFAPVEDDEVLELLAGEGTPARVRRVTLEVCGAELHGDLAVPRGARGRVIFAHGAGSSRRSPRNRSVARVLRRGGLGTLLVDLLEEAEEGRRDAVFDIPRLAGRLEAVTRWARTDPVTRDLPLGLFGASTGAAAALRAAADLGADVAAVVCRGGRPDLAGEDLSRVEAPTLFIVGGEDREVLALNRHAAGQLHGAHELVVVPGATHLFEEPGALEEVASLAAGWFGAHLVGARTPALAGG
ncbi:MAG TPA: alpha/beta family hydrolase [Baekduia sp.]|nr:alpha/beta family hydrolase [Baekduia sp.]